MTIAQQFHDRMLPEQEKDDGDFFDRMQAEIQKAAIGILGIDENTVAWVFRDRSFYYIRKCPKGGFDWGIGRMLPIPESEHEA